MCKLELSFIFLMYRYFFRFSHVFTADSGNSLGDLIGHSAAVNAISFRPERPFRLVSASEDNSLCFYEGPPFKFKVSLKVNIISILSLLCFFTRNVNSIDVCIWPMFYSHVLSSNLSSKWRNFPLRLLILKVYKLHFSNIEYGCWRGI